MTLISDAGNLNRTTAPTLGSLEARPMEPARRWALDNGIPVHSIAAGTQEVVKIEWVFAAGGWYQPKKLVASSTVNMLIEGTGTRTGKAIAEHIDFYGAYLHPEIDKDFSSLSLYTLNRHLPQVLPVIEEVLKTPSFPQQALDTHLNQVRQTYRVNREKVGYLARGRFLQTLFGAAHPYGWLLEEEDLEALVRQDLVDFFHQHYHADQCTIIVAGQPDDTVQTLLNRHFGGTDWSSASSAVAPRTAAALAGDKKTHVLKEGAVQSAIRLGRSMVNQQHPDFHGLRVLNTVLGGYFGSRLMRNIREDKGYTYGINSQLVPLVQGGYWAIGTEVGSAVTGPALEEIYAELARLRKETIPEEELTLVRNFLTGQFLRQHDGPFSLAERLKGIVFYGLEYTYFDDYLQTLNTITPEVLRSLADRYFQPEDLYLVVAGNEEVSEQV